MHAASSRVHIAQAGRLGAARRSARNGLGPLVRPRALNAARPAGPPGGGDARGIELRAHRLTGRLESGPALGP